MRKKIKVKTLLINKFTMALIVLLPFSSALIGSEFPPLNELKYLNSEKGIEQSRKNRNYVKRIYRHQNKIINCESVELTGEFFDTAGNYGGSG